MSKPNVMETPQQKVTSLRQFLDADTVRGAISKALPKHLGVDRLLRQCLTLVQGNPDLIQCTQPSILSGILKSAELGL